MTKKRTNIEIDMDLVEEIKTQFGLRTTTEAVDLALRNLVPTPMTKQEALAMAGAHLTDHVPEDRLPPHLEEEIEAEEREAERRREEA